MSKKKSITPLVKKACELYFGCTVGMRTKSGHHIFAIFTWLAHSHSPINEFRSLCDWERTRLSSYLLLLLLNKIIGHNPKSKCAIVYPSIPSALRPVEHDSPPIIKLPQPWTLHKKEPTSTCPEDESGPSYSHVDSNFPERTAPILISQSEIKDHVRDLKLSKIQREFLTFLLEGWKLLQQGVKVSYRKSQQSFSSFFSKDGELIYCNDVEGLLQELVCMHNSQEGRL